MGNKISNKISKSSNTILVAAIDFGTTYSGYAFSFRDKPNDVQSPQTWYAGSTQLASLKTPTCLLIRDGEKTLFGYEAENTYAELTGNKEYNEDESYFFQHFKMLLHENKNLSRSTRVDDINGKSMQALKVFSLSIEYFKNHLLETLQTRSAGVNLEEIHFVLTVPAIWDDSAKQFMREAAVEAGLDNDRLTIALEPEAALIYCQNLPTDKFASSCKFEVAKAGTEYMVVDLGDRICSKAVYGWHCGHNSSQKGSRRVSKLPPCYYRGQWGGQMVNEEFINFYTEIVGTETMQKFRLQQMGDYFELLRDFETKKRTISPGNDSKIFIRIPASLREIYEKPEQSFEEAVQRSRYSQFIKLMLDKLQVNKHFIAQMFKKSIDATINHVSTLLDEPKMRSVDWILLVGGYSECPLILEAFRNRFREKRIINPHQAGLAVINGAVHFGHNPTVISSRILSFTYGTHITLVFKEGIHPEELKFVDSEGTCRCDDVFDILKHKGDCMKLGDKISQIRHPLTKSQSKLTLRVYSSSDRDPKYTTGCTALGHVTVNLPPYTGTKRKVPIDFVFGMTEFMVKITDQTTKKEIRKYFNLSE